MISLCAEEVQELKDDIVRAQKDQGSFGEYEAEFAKAIGEQIAICVLITHDLIFGDNDIPCGHVPIPLFKRVDPALPATVKAS